MRRGCGPILCIKKGVHLFATQKSYYCPPKIPIWDGSLIILYNNRIFGHFNYVFLSFFFLLGDKYSFFGQAMDNMHLCIVHILLMYNSS